MSTHFFSLDSPKAIKAQAYGYLNAINYMAPASTAGVGNLLSPRQRWLLSPMPWLVLWTSWYALERRARNRDERRPRLKAAQGAPVHAG